MEQEMTVQKTTRDKIIDYITYFFIYSFLGWIIETIYAILVNGYFVKRGFLYGPLCPIYGFGAVLLILSTRKLYGKPFLKFLIATIAFTAFPDKPPITLPSTGLPEATSICIPKTVLIMLIPSAPPRSTALAIIPMNRTMDLINLLTTRHLM